MEKEFFIDDDGIKIHAKLFKPENTGSCPLVIIVHGFTGHMEEPHIAGAAEAVNSVGCASLRVEMYGHGKSDGEFKDHTLYKWVSNMLRVVDYAKKLDFVTNIYLCGHSQGGLLTMLIAGMCPDVFRAVIPMSPAWKIPENARKGIMLGVKVDPVNIPDEFSMNEKGVLSGAYIRTAQTIHPEDEISRYDRPVLLIHGDADETCLYEDSVTACRMYKNAKLVTIPGDDHCYNRSLDLVLEALKEFLISMESEV